MTGVLSPLEVDSFFETIKDPSAFSAALQEAKTFISQQYEQGRKLVVVSSGGTVVPLERQMVRFLDNFSAGSRGAISTEWFLRHGYSVIFLHRQYSFKPFSRKFRSRDESILDYLETSKVGSIEITDAVKSDISETYKEYDKYKHERGQLLELTFFTVSDYLYLLMEISKLCQCFGSNVMVYLAAAVSDFYLPENRLSDHKIQSEEGTLTLKLEPVPKLIQYIVSLWAPKAFVVTFKLETNPDLLLIKAEKALKLYGHQVVVANLLKDRKREVVILEASGALTTLQVEDPTQEEIERLLVERLIKLHQKFIQ